MSTSPCRFCRHVNPPAAKFCNECGSPLHLRPCPNCDAITDATAQACHQCGASFVDDGAVALMGETLPGDTGAGKERRHVPESLAECLDTRALGASAPMTDPGGRSRAVLPAGGALADRQASPAIGTRRAPAGDGEEMIADDALPPSAASHDAPGAGEATHAEDDRDDDLAAVVVNVANRDAGERATESIANVAPIRGPAAGERPVRRVARAHPLHPVAWAVVLAALGGAGYYAYAERARWTPWLADVAAMVRGGGAQTAHEASPGPPGDGKSATATTPARSASSPKSTDVAERGADNASTAAVGPDATASPTPHEAAENLRTVSPHPATGDEATAKRAAVTSRAPTATRAEPATTAAPARPDRAPMPNSAAADTAASKGGAPTAATKKAPIGRREDAARAVDAPKPTNADALATKRLIERELGEFLPPDAKRPPQSSRSAE
jgi:hypothetical protein